jgi:phosphate transport system substrate-binding protein
MSRQSLTTILSLVLSGLVFACARPEPAADSTTDRQTITVKGSDTMVLLGQRWAEEYMNHPATVQVEQRNGVPH